jgi:MATE family multidrug resistance protein
MFYLCGIAPGLPFLLVAVCYRGIISLQPNVKCLVGVAAATVAVKAGLAGIGYAWLWEHGISARCGLLLCGVTTSLTFVAMAAAAWLTPRRSIGQSLSAISPDATLLGAKQIFRRGLTIGLTAALQAGFFSLVALICGACSAVDLAAHQVANQCTLLPLMLAFGMSQAAATLTSLALGAHSRRMALRVGWEAVYFGIAAMFVIAALLLTLGHFAIAAILPVGIPERDHVASLAWRLIVVGALSLAADGAHNVAMGALRGLNQGRLTIYSAIVGYWLVGIPLAWWLGVRCGMGAVGVWIGVGAGLYVSAGMLLCFLYRATRATAVE